jgi:hypothetical protein
MSNKFLGKSFWYFFSGKVFHSIFWIIKYLVLGFVFLFIIFYEAFILNFSGKNIFLI